MDEHDLVVALKALALELGHVPTRNEFREHTKAHEKIVNKVFGSYTVLLRAAGFDKLEKQPRITNDIFRVGLDHHLERYEPRAVHPKTPNPTIAIISDIHWPFEMQRVVDAFIKFVKDHQPEYVIINGDAVDFYSFSRFPRSHNIFTPKEEINSSRKKNEEFWAEIKKISPKSKCIQMLGNHCIRPMKAIMDSLPAAEDWIKEALRKQFSFEGVETIFDPREEFMIGDIMVHHGFRSKLGDHRDYSHYNCIVGHTHNGGAVFRKIRGQVIWELNSGYAGDPESKGLSYTAQKTTVWTHGFGYVDQYGPRFIPV